MVSKMGVGPVLAVSVKGNVGAFRNLTNRMEEAVGDATNIHLMYPGLVYGFFHVLKATPTGHAGAGPNDVALDETGDPVASIRRYSDVLVALQGRRLVRDEFSRYEAIALALADPIRSGADRLISRYPADGHPLRPDRFFSTLLSIYDLRYPYVAPSIPVLRRLEWDPRSPALAALGGPDEWAERLGYEPRVLST